MTPASLLFGILFTTLAIIWVEVGEAFAHAGNPAETVPGTPAVGLLLVLLGVSYLLKLARRWVQLNPAEIITIYVMMLVAVPLSSQGMWGLFYTCTMQQTRVAIYENKPDYVKFSQDIPERYVPRKKEIYDGWYDAAPMLDLEPLPWWRKLVGTITSNVPWDYWGPTLLLWGVLLATLWGMMMCLSAILRKQWADRERLTFPLVILPTELVGVREHGEGHRPPLWRSQLFWVGCIVVLALQGINGLHVYIPEFPYIPVMEGRGFLFTTIFQDPPWKIMATGGGSWTFKIYPFVIGMAYFVHQEVGLSIVLFYLLTRLQLLFGGVTGLSELKITQSFSGAARFPFLIEQTWGAMLVIAVFSIWLARKHLADVVRKAFTRAPDVDDSNEPMSYRTAFFGLVLGVGILAAWSHAAGFPWGIALLFFGLCLVYGLSVAKIRAESGVPGIWMMPYVTDIMYSLGGSAKFGTKAMNWVMHLHFLVLGWYFTMQAFQMEAMKAGDIVKVQRRQITRALWIGWLMAFFVAGYMLLSIAYKFGLSRTNTWWSGAGNTPATRFIVDAVAAVEGTHPGWEPLQVGAAAVGAVVMGFLMAMRLWFVNWPLHPIGYALAGTYTSARLYGSILIAWAVKTVVLRLGGVRMYQKIMPLFLGLIIGDMLSMALWGVVGMISKANGGPVYGIYPW